MNKIEKAHRTRDILEQPEFKEALAYIRAENVKKWQSCDPKDEATQRECKYLDRAINELLKRFKQVLEDGLLEEATQARNEAIKQRKAKRT